jgi:flagellar biosynthesis protein FlhF
MRVKRYVVDSMPDALQRIRSDLGKNAVILNTKEVRSGGFLGMFGKKKIEVIAATDSTPGGTAEKPAVSANPSLSPFPSAPSLPVAQSSSSPNPLTKTSLHASIAVQEELASALADVNVPKRTTKQDDILLDEMKQMKELIYQLTVINRDKSSFPQEFHKWEARLQQHEIDPILVRMIMDNAVSASRNAGPCTQDQARSYVKHELLRILNIEQFTGIAPSTKIVHFVGPTGVGKTTTIAKLAAEQVLKHNRKVGFITSDTYRIAAVEQLKTYATILNVPLEVVFSPQELSKAVQQLKDRDIIFMDTAGRNYRNEMYVSELNSLLQTKGHTETYLVHSLSTKYKDMKVITENFAKFKLDKVLFTKMDETDSYGSIINLAHEFSLQLSYLTNGQNVPDDITEFDQEHFIDLILEDDIHD